MDNPTREKSKAPRSGHVPRRCSGEKSEWKGDQRRHEQRAERQLEGRGKARADQLGDAGLLVKRGAQIAGYKAGEKSSVLCVKRLVEAQASAQLFLVGGAGGLAEHHFHRIAGHRVDEEKDQGQRAQQGRQKQRQAAQKVALHDGWRPAELGENETFLSEIRSPSG